MYHLTLLKAILFSENYVKFSMTKTWTILTLQISSHEALLSHNRYTFLKQNIAYLKSELSSKMKTDRIIWEMTGWHLPVGCYRFDFFLKANWFSQDDSFILAPQTVYIQFLEQWGRASRREVRQRLCGWVLSSDTGLPRCWAVKIMHCSSRGPRFWSQHLCQAAHNQL